ncbi:hypothetical protein DID88_009730 [Monilinia fructigena]|uniref:Zinc finger PHD-type domain-containing protein n=1 Tax=Monilinia fructigena TaxID=38457 RepID=A0A395IL10_9HELO|nr:hypothetical protein DID88_009730 [Monilinia fructigena]
MADNKKEEIQAIDYSLNNPDTLTKYKNAAQISQKVLEAVTAFVRSWYWPSNHRFSFSYVTPYTPLTSDEAEASVVLKRRRSYQKFQLGAQIDGFGTILCDTIIVHSAEHVNGEITGRDADLFTIRIYNIPLAKVTFGVRSQLKGVVGSVAGATSEEAMSQLNSRPTRSRRSSPFVSAQCNPNSSPATVADSGRKRTFMDKWTEPPLPAPLPSFAEAGMERHGVVANMAPLGTRPSAKAVKSSAKSEGGDTNGSRRNGVTEVIADTPTITPPVSTTPQEQTQNFEPISNVSRRRSTSARIEDLEYAPPSTPQQPRSARKSLTRSSVPPQSVRNESEGPSMYATSPALQRTPLPEHTQLPQKYTSSTTIPFLSSSLGNGFTATNEDFNGNLDASATGSGRITKKQQNGIVSASTSAEVLSSPPKLSDRPRAVSVSSSSSLSSVDEQILDNEEYSPMDFDHDQNHVGTTKSLETKGKGIVRTANANANANANAKFGTSVSTETQSNTGGSISQKQPIKSKYLSKFESDTLLSMANKTNKSRAINKSKTSSPATPSFSAINIPTRSHNTNTNSSNRIDTDNTQVNSNMAPELIRASSSSSVGSVPVLKPVVPKKPQIVWKSKKKQAIDRPTYEESEMVGKWKRKAREITNGITEELRTESFERPNIEPSSTGSTLPVGDISDGDSTSIPATLPTTLPTTSSTSNRPVKTIRLVTKNERTSRRQTTTAPVNHYDSEMSSPTGLGFQPDFPPGSLPSSRAGTPSSNRPSRKAKNGTGLRVKNLLSSSFLHTWFQWPMKKKSGPSAGIPRASGERDSPIGGSYPSQQPTDNDDYCASCGGTLADEEWYCNACLAREVPQSEEETGFFGHLLSDLERKNPSAFHLPKAIREYFENVKTGTEGEYEEGVVQKPKNNRGYDETPDYFKLKDNKGNPILCHSCHLSASQPSRAIIPCSYCSLFWHLDCLDPPLAKEPPPGRSWRCPAHVDDLLEKVPGTLGPAHRFRKIKGASLIKPILSRGVRNNGHIEIENTPSEDEDQGSGFYEQREYGHVYKLPEEGIKLDFISRIHREFGQYNQRSFIKNRSSVPQSRSPIVEFNRRGIDEQQAALNLAYLATANPSINLTQSLIDALISEADEPVIKLIAKGDASKLSTKNHYHKLINHL